MYRKTFGAAEWYKHEKENRERRMKANEISLLNQRIQRLMATLREEINSNEQFKRIVLKANGHSRVNVMRIYGCQQYESDKVAFHSLECLLRIIPELPKTDIQKRQWKECENLVYQLVHIDWKYNELLHRSYDEAKRKQCS